MKRLLTLLLLLTSLWTSADQVVVFPHPAVGGGSAVSLDAKMAAGNSGDGLTQECNNATSCSSTGITVTASATILVALLHCQGDGGDAARTSYAATWNSTPMTEAAMNPGGVIFANVTAIWYLMSPAAGANTLATTWVGGSTDCYMTAISFRNATGISGGHTTIPDATTVTVTSDANGATVAVYGADGSAPTTNFVKIATDDPLNPGYGASYQLGGTSNAHTFTGGGGTTPVGAGIHIVN